MFHGTSPYKYHNIRCVLQFVLTVLHDLLLHWIYFTPSVSSGGSSARIHSARPGNRVLFLTGSYRWFFSPPSLPFVGKWGSLSGGEVVGREIDHSVSHVRNRGAKTVLGVIFTEDQGLPYYATIRSERTQLLQ